MLSKSFRGEVSVWVGGVGGREKLVAVEAGEGERVTGKINETPLKLIVGRECPTRL